MAINRYFSSTAQPTTLSGSISSGATSITVGAVTGFPTSYPYTLALDYGGATEELVDVSAAAGTILTVARAVDGTSAQSHSLGAVVRHVASARDFSDYQTHQNTTTAVHGVTGTLVGTSDTQTLSNKTLSGGVLTGTFTGSPTLSGAPAFSGAPTFSGVAVFTGNPLFQGGATTTDVLGTIVSGDSNRRFIANADGALEWGPGNAASDTFLLREGAKQLSTTDTLLRVYRGSTSDSALSVRVTGDANSRFQVVADGTVTWGAGGGSSADVNLYRNAADVLKTDDSLIVGANFTIGSATYRNLLSTGPTTVANTTTETVIATGTIAANDAVAGAIYRMTAYGVASSTGTPNFTLTARLGGVAGTTMASIGPSATAAAISGRPWHAVYYLRCVSSGVSAVWSPTFVVYHNLTTAAQVGNNIQIPNTTADQTVDSTASKTMVVTWTWGTASSSNTATCTGVVFERVA